MQEVLNRAASSPGRSNYGPQNECTFTHEPSYLHLCREGGQLLMNKAAAAARLVFSPMHTNLHLY